MTTSTTLSESDGAIVVVAKCPLPGKSKTRLMPMLGEEGSATLAKAMLSDVLCGIASLPIAKILYYAPGTSEGRHIMQSLLEELGIVDAVQLVPMLHGDLRSRDLGNQLANALTEAKKLVNGPIMFLGMDAPELPLDEIRTALTTPTHATLCPSQDGGYGMLTVPHDTPSSIFDSVLWSHPLTAVSQLKSLSDAQIPIRLGRIMHDIDEPEDVQVLAHRLHNSDALQDFKSLQLSSFSSNNNTPENSSCLFTNQALEELKDLIGQYGDTTST